MKGVSWFLICLMIASSCASKKQNSPTIVDVTAYRVEAQTLPANFTFVGVAKSSHPVEIRSRVEGYLMSIDYVEGERVKKDALLFRIDPRQFQADVEEAQAIVAKEEAVLWSREKSLERIEPLYEKNAASKRDLDNAIASKLAAEANVLSAKANLTKAELNLSYTYITSPVQGLTGRAIYREGTLITPTIDGLLTTVLVLDPIWVDFSMSDNEILTLSREKEQKRLILPEESQFVVSLTLADNSLYPYLGKVNFAAPILDVGTASMMMRATFPNPEGQLLPEQFVRVTVCGGERPNALIVPQVSVFQGRKGMYVYVIDANNHVTSRNVELGDTYENYFIVKAGLEQEDLIVVEGINKVHDGAKVHVTSVVNMQ